MSRREKRRGKGAPFVMLEKNTLNSQDWKKLSHPEMLTYIYIKKNYNGTNNGEISLKYSELKGIMAPGTIANALKGLITKEWIEKTKHGGMFRYYCLYKLTGKYDQIR